MKSKSKSPAVPKVDPYLEGLMGKLLDRLVSLENKMDTVISQTARNVSGNRESAQPGHVHDNRPQMRRDRVLYEAVCADCSKACKVPFRPTEDRAVYCKECFALRKSGASRSGSKAGMPVLTPAVIPSGEPSAKPAVFQSAPDAGKSRSKKKKSAPVKKKKRGKK